MDSPPLEAVTLLQNQRNPVPSPVEDCQTLAKGVIRATRAISAFTALMITTEHSREIVQTTETSRLSETPQNNLSALEWTFRHAWIPSWIIRTIVSVPFEISYGESDRFSRFFQPWQIFVFSVWSDEEKYNKPRHSTVTFLSDHHPSFAPLFLNLKTMARVAPHKPISSLKNWDKKSPGDSQAEDVPPGLQLVEVQRLADLYLSPLFLWSVFSSLCLVF